MTTTAAVVYILNIKLYIKPFFLIYMLLLTYTLFFLNYIIAVTIVLYLAMCLVEPYMDSECL